jgi:hypothetical protein
VLLTVLRSVCVPLHVGSRWAGQNHTLVPITGKPYHAELPSLSLNVGKLRGPLSLRAGSLVVFPSDRVVPCMVLAVLEWSGQGGWVGP